MVDDPRFKDQMKALKDLTDQFNEMGFEAVFIPSDDGGYLDLDFYSRRMFEYDIVLLDTHGGYNEENELHGFLTGERYIGDAADLWLWNNLGLPSLTDIDALSNWDVSNGFDFDSMFENCYNLERLLGTRFSI